MQARGIPHEVSIDSTGEIARFDLGDSPSQAHVVSLNLEAAATASYAVDVGVRDGDGVRWFEGEATYADTDAISDAWEQADRYLRVRVTSAAAADETATIAVSTGR